MYELKDSYFIIFATPYLIAFVIVLIIASYFFLRDKKRNKTNIKYPTIGPFS